MKRKLVFFDFFNTFGGAQQSTLTLVNKVAEMRGRESVVFMGPRGTSRNFVSRLNADFCILRAPFSNLIFHAKENLIFLPIVAAILQASLVIKLFGLLSKGYCPVVVVSSQK